MHRLTSRLLLVPLTFACFSVAHAKTNVVKYPSDDPAFTVEFPPGWTHQVDKDGTLNCDPGDNSGYVFSILALGHVGNEQELKTELPKLAKIMAGGAKLRNFKAGDFDNTENASGVQFIGVKGAGKTNGVTMDVLVNGFEAQKGRFYAIITASSEEADKKHADDYEAIAASIKPLGSKSKGKEAGVKSSGKEEHADADKSTSQAEADSPKSSTGLPGEYADYLIAPDSPSPNGKFAVMIPKAKLCPDEPRKGAANKCKDYVVALKPFQVLTALESEFPEFENKNHGGMHVTWSTDNSAVLVTLDQKWGPNEIFLCEIADGKVTRSTNLLGKLRDMLVADCKKAIPDRADDCPGVFVVEDDKPVATFAGTSQVKIRVTAKTDPKESPGRPQWDGEAQATWDISKAEFTSQKVTRKFAGVRKD